MNHRVRANTPDDVKAVTELIVAEERTLRGSSRWTEAQTRDWFHGLAGEGAMRIVERNGQLAGFVGLFFGPITRGWIAFDPWQRDERIGSTLVQIAEQLARERKAGKVQISAFAENRIAIDLLQRAGFRDDRHFYTMHIDLGDRPPAPQWPDGITCTTFERADARLFYDATIDAFLDDEEDFHPLPYEEWKRRQLEAPEFDPTLWFIARGGNEVAGIARCWPQRWGCGWVDVLGVRKPWRRRGVGLALLQQTFAAFYALGRACVGLEVDTKNPTGATRLYERAGMHVVAEDVAYIKELQ